MTAKINLILEGQTDIKNELITNNEEHKKFADWKWTIDFINKKFSLK